MNNASNDENVGGHFVSTPSDEREFDVLAGRIIADPSKPGEVRMAQLREFFIRQEQEEPPLDEATKERLMQKLRDRGAFN